MSATVVRVRWVRVIAGWRAMPVWVSLWLNDDVVALVPVMFVKDLVVLHRLVGAQAGVALAE